MDTSMIYGQEKVRYSWTGSSDYDAIIADTLDWTIADTELNGDDATTDVVDAANDATQDKVYKSAGTKTVHTEVDFDDGWGGIYKHATDLEVEAVVYDVPVLSMAWTPEKPTILEETTFTQDHDDTRDEDANKAYGRIDRVDIDYFDDGTIDEEDIAEDAEFKHTFAVKEDDGIYIRLLVKYWDGWETKDTSIVNHLEQTNIPPVSDSTREDNGMCIPAYVWTATSSDVDDDASELTYEWKLYKKDDKGTEDEDDDEWEELETGTEETFTYPFQYEGDYKLVLRTTDDDGDWHEKIEEFPIVFDACDSGGGNVSGTIVLQPNSWQNIAIPVPGVRVKEYFLDKVAAIVEADASTVIEVVKAYGSNDVNSSKYQVFIPDLTNPDSSTNFELIQSDGEAREITAFRVKTKDFEGTIDVAWDAADGSE